MVTGATKGIGCKQESCASAGYEQVTRCNESVLGLRVMFGSGIAIGGDAFSGAGYWNVSVTAREGEKGRVCERRRGGRELGLSRPSRERQQKRRA